MPTQNPSKIMKELRVSLSWSLVTLTSIARMPRDRTKRELTQYASVCRNYITSARLHLGEINGDSLQYQEVVDFARSSNDFISFMVPYASYLECSLYVPVLKLYSNNIKDAVNSYDETKTKTAYNKIKHNMNDALTVAQQIIGNATTVYDHRKQGF